MDTCKDLIHYRRSEIIRHTRLPIPYQVNLKERYR